MKVKLSALISLIEGKTNKKVVLKKRVLKESVRHGIFPGFTVDFETKKIKYFTASNDLASSACNENLYDNPDNMKSISFCTESNGQAYIKKLAEDVVKMLKAKKTKKEVQLFLRKQAGWD